MIHENPVHPDHVLRDPRAPRAGRADLEILDGVARELMPAVWGLGVQCSVLRLPKDLTPRERRFIEAVEQNVGRVTRVLASVHDYLLAERDGELPLDPRPAELSALCDDAVAQLREAGFDDAIEIEAQGSGEGAWDAERLAEALSYLLECALHAAPEDAAIRLRWRGEPREVVVTIERPARPGELPAEIDVGFGERIGAGPEDGVKVAVARRVIVAHGGTLARLGAGRSIVYVAVLPRTPPEELT